mmetsp:Transcript_26388/g.58100  ORF Transcript_26388/g.58100 Transcript_26388/m.58100 type:complete len:142 (+) Transcript_26388:381-806(+)
MIFYRATIVATATLLSVLQSNIGFVSSLSTSPASAASRRDVLSQSTKVIFGAATSSLLAVSPFKVRAGVKQVIRGWDLTLLDMKEGESRKIVVPPALGYGAKGVGPIPGNCVLYFEMTLTKVGPVEELTADAKKWLEENPL